MTEPIRLTFPLTDLDALRQLQAGQRVLISGHIIGIRDATQIRMFDQGQKPPMDLTGAALLHTAPNVRRHDDGTYEKLCIGTTTSTRMSRFTRGLMETYGVRAIMGKAGLLPDALPVLQQFGGAYFGMVGGAASVSTTHIEEIEQVEWEDLMPECLWRFRVRDFGPLIVGLDSHGHSLYHEVTMAARERLERIMPGGLQSQTT